MGSSRRHLSLRSHEARFALGGLVGLRRKRGVMAPASNKQPLGQQANAAWLTATLTYGSQFGTMPLCVAERINLREVLR